MTDTLERRMKIEPKTKSTLSEPRGQMMTAKEIAEDPELFNDTVSPKWVLNTVPGKMRFGHSTVRWYRNDVIAYIRSCEESAA